METLAHSRQPNKPAVPLSGKINAGGFSGKTLYDDIYGGPPPKLVASGLSPRFEDYSEIFGSFHAPRASSIPVLDLPAVDEADAFFDPRSSAFSYTEVFGALDFAASFEDLFHQPNGFDGVSSDEAWTPEDTDSFSGESDHFANNQTMPNRDYFQSVDGDTEFNISYHNANGASTEHRSKGKSHMTQMHEIPGSTLVYDETIMFHKNDPSFGADKVKANHPRKTSRPRNFTSRERAFLSDVNLHNDSHSAEMFITVSDISLRSMPSQVPPPSRPPPILDAKNRDPYGFHPNSRQVASEETRRDTSPPLFDVEVDTNASAAATKEATQKGEARLQSAKEMKERKKGAHDSRVESSYDVKDSERKTRSNCFNDGTLQETCDRRTSKLRFSASDERQKGGKAAPETPDTMEGKRILNMFTEEHPNESRSSQESDRSNGDVTWKEETEFFELVGTDESRKRTQPTKPTKILVQDTRIHGNSHKGIVAAPGMQEGYKKVIATEEYYQEEEYEQKFNAAKEVDQTNKNILGPKASNEEYNQNKQVKKGKVTEIFEQEENEKGVRVAPQNGKTEKNATEADQSGSLKDVPKMRDKVQKQLHIKKLEVVDRQTSSEVQLGERLEENKKKLKEAEKQSQSVKTQKQPDKIKENGKRQREALVFGQAGDKEKLKDSVELEENEEQLKEEFEMEVNEIRLQEDFKQREKQAYERDLNKREHNEAFDGYGDRNTQAGDNEGTQNVLHQAPREEWNADMLNEALRKNEFESSSTQTFDGEGSSIVSNEEGNHTDRFENMGNDVSGMGEDNNSGSKDLDQMQGIEVKGNMKIAKATDETLEEEIGKNLLAAQSASIRLENIGKLKVSQEPVADKEIGKTRSECKGQETKLEDLRVENQAANKKVRVPEIILGDKQDLRPTSGKVDDGMMKADYGRNTAAKGGTMLEAVNVQGTAQSTEIKEKSLNETSATVPKDAERMRRERESEKDRLRKIEEEQDREREREREREKDRMAVDKAMLEVEREREREKDRMAVDRATFEARDRAYAEACERAERAAFERATAEALQRALAEARERLEKACAEARDWSYADKVATEARLKAERAAVERATAEAQERAKEKLKVERAAFESRERLQRSVSDQYAASSRNCGTQVCSPSDTQFQNFSSSAGSRHPYSLYGASSFSERSEVEGESARRCRSRLERHRRTAERAAKALAEKNMRDHLAQKEQAERHRLAETLDAEVKRWSSGKEGNLRALLSTLQYILGPDSGWQPIPLTEVITSAAVKKAYRKATLCVHPDKLQQRGASVQHKYICEKVFDLLKDAWNKFNSEER
ncbi:Auxilin-like protein [Arachis hypogaea]|nr:Auxilin-like protein [Arachis hypogaea]